MSRFFCTYSLVRERLCYLPDKGLSSLTNLVMIQETVRKRHSRVSPIPLYKGWVMERDVLGQDKESSDS